MRVTVIGANGFIGRVTCRTLAERGHMVTAVIRRHDVKHLAGAHRILYIDDAGPNENWEPVVEATDAIVHLVSPSGANTMDGTLLAEYRRVVVDGTVAMARAATAAGTKRLVFVSTIKVNGEATVNRPFTPESIPAPKTEYGRIKLKAENVLRANFTSDGPTLTVIRPAAVYGPGSGGNINLMVNLFRRLPGWLVPLGGINNRRAIIYVGNLASAISRCCEDRSGKARLFLLHDGAMVTTTEMCRAILVALGKSTALAPDPGGLVEGLIRIVAPEISQRLHESLEVEDDGIARELEWRAPFSLGEGIAMIVRSDDSRG